MGNPEFRGCNECRHYMLVYGYADGDGWCHKHEFVVDAAAGDTCEDWEGELDE